MIRESEIELRSGFLECFEVSDYLDLPMTDLIGIRSIVFYPFSSLGLTDPTAREDCSLLGIVPKTCDA